MRRITVVVVLSVLLVTALLAVAGPALAGSATIFAASPSTTLTGPLVVGQDITFKYIIAGDPTALGAGVVCDVYIYRSPSGGRVVAKVGPYTVVAGTVGQEISLSPAWDSTLKPGTYEWILLPRVLDDSLTFVDNQFRVVRHLR